jgi:hypothetical protein
MHEFAIAVDVAKLKRDKDIVLAWHIAALTRGTKGLPKLESLLLTRAKRVQSLAEQRANLTMILGPGKPVSKPH